MPFAKRKISPVKLARRKISESDKFDLTVVCNNALLDVLNQLASLTLHADNLFSELAQECENVHSRTTSIQERLQNVEKYVDKLDFRSVPIRTYFKFFYANVNQYVIHSYFSFKALAYFNYFKAKLPKWYANFSTYMFIGYSPDSRHAHNLYILLLHLLYSH